MEAPEVHYAPCGEGSVAWAQLGDGPLDLLFVPGFISHLELWWELTAPERFLRRLATFSRLILFDKRGTGLSDPIDTAQPLEDRFDELIAVLDAAGSERAAVLALSEGGMIAMSFAATHPGRVRSLVLCNTTPRVLAAPDWPHGVGEKVERWMLGSLGGWGTGRNAAEYWCPSVAGDPRAVRMLARLQRMSSSPTVADRIVRTMLAADVRSVLPTIQAPTLVMHATEDHTLPFEAGRALAELIPGAEFRAIESRDHLPWMEGAADVLDETEEFLTGTRPAPEPDRVLATVLFADLVGSTRRAAELGDRRWREVLGVFESRADGIVERWRGRRVKFLGDGMLASFDGPGRAVSAAAALRDAIADLGEQLRCGLHTGECERVGDDLAGLAVHIGARVGALAEPGEVLATQTVRDLTAGSGISWSDRGARELRGVPGEWRLYAAQTSS